MKKLFLGLIAVVMFGVAGNAHCKNELTFEKQKVSVQQKGIGCVILNAGYVRGGFYVEVSTKLCCWKTSAFSPTYSCSFFSLKPEEQLTGYIDVESLPIKLLEHIDKTESPKISITKSAIGEIDGRYIQIETGEYTIETENNRRFIKVNLTEIKK